MVAVVSVIIPVYNTERYVEQAIRSVMQQTLKEIEIIVVDDGSTDSSLNILRCLQKEDNRIRLISQSNSGQAAARNRGVEISSGQYIYFMDSDDILDCETLSRCVIRCETDGSDFVFFDAEIFSETQHLRLPFDYHRDHFLTEGVYDSCSVMLQLMQRNLFRCAPGLLFIKKEFVVEKGLVFESIHHEDELYTRLLFLMANRASYIPQPFFKRRLREESVMTTAYSEKDLQGYLSVVKKLSEYGNEPLHTPLQRQLTQMSLNMILDNVFFRCSIFPFRRRMRALITAFSYAKHLRIKTWAVLLFPVLIKISQKVFRHQ
jgi:glycosyltransferase involved in cell wall biosynthesis